MSPSPSPNLTKLLILQMDYLTKIRYVEIKLFHVDRRTERYQKNIGGLSQISELALRNLALHLPVMEILHSSQFIERDILEMVFVIIGHLRKTVTESERDLLHVFLINHSSITQLNSHHILANI
jgi:hypothetical protein